MPKKPTVSGGQLFAFMYLSRVVVTLTYSINSASHTISNADWAVALLLPPLLFLLCLPVYGFLKVANGASVIDFAYETGGGAGRFFSLSYAVFFFLLSVIPVARFSYFVTSAMQTEKGTFFFPVLLMLAAGYAAFRGMEPILRTGSILAAFSVVSVAALCVFLIPRIHTAEWYSPFYEPYGTVTDSCLLLLSNSFEPAAVLMLAPHVKGGVKKPMLLYFLLAPLTVAVVFAVTLGVLGPYARLQLFPFYTAVGMARLGDGGDLSALVASVWILGVFVKSGMYLLLSHLCLRPLLPEKWHIPSLILLTVSAAVAAGLNSYSVNTAQIDFSTTLLLATEGVFILLFPTVLTVTALLKKRRTPYVAE